jgi:hypothetical protein
MSKASTPAPGKGGRQAQEAGGLSTGPAALEGESSTLLGMRSLSQVAHSRCWKCWAIEAHHALGTG